MSNLKNIDEWYHHGEPDICITVRYVSYLGTTSSAINGMSMGLATMFVLICSNIVISALKT